jgi:hypothetical protein
MSDLNPIAAVLIALLGNILSALDSPATWIVLALTAVLSALRWRSYATIVVAVLSGTYIVCTVVPWSEWADLAAVLDRAAWIFVAQFLFAMAGWSFGLPFRRKIALNRREIRTDREAND